MTRKRARDVASGARCATYDASTSRDAAAGDWRALSECGDGEGLLAWLVAPAPASALDGRAVVRARRSRDGAAVRGGWFTFADLEAALGGAAYGMDVDVTSYARGRRRTHNGNDFEDKDGRVNAIGEVVDAKTVMRRFREDGCSIRLLHPQTRHDGCWKMLATLESHLGAACGCNVYATPANSQGFAPHYDDIDAFVIQLEGAKRWRVYAPFADDELPRTSSKNFSQEDIAELEMVFDGTLEAGDFLYVPRGFVHQAECAKETHSVHATFSCQQANTYADALEFGVRHALNVFIHATPATRSNLAPNYGTPWRRRGEGGAYEECIARCGEFYKLFAAHQFTEDARRNEFAVYDFDQTVRVGLGELAARFQAQRLPVPESHRARSSAKCTGDAAAARLRSGEAREVAAQRSGCCVILQQAPGYFVAYHPYQNERDGSHERVVDVSSATSRCAVPLAVPDDVGDALIQTLHALDDMDGESIDVASEIQDEFGAREDVELYMGALCELVRVGVLAVAD